MNPLSGALGKSGRACGMGIEACSEGLAAGEDTGTAGAGANWGTGPRSGRSIAFGRA